MESFQKVGRVVGTHQSFFYNKLQHSGSVVYMLFVGTEKHIDIFNNLKTFLKNKKTYLTRSRSICSPSRCEFITCNNAVLTDTYLTKTYDLILKKHTFLFDVCKKMFAHLHFLEDKITEDLNTLCIQGVHALQLHKIPI